VITSRSVQRRRPISCAAAPRSISSAAARESGRITLITQSVPQVHFHA
jgi:hypothetical protein